MIQDKVMKIIKGLNIFSQDDIVVMTGLDEDETDNILAELVQEEKIIRLGNEYRYLNSNPIDKFSLNLKDKPVRAIIENDNITFLQAAEYFLSNHSSKNCLPTTFKTYKSLIKHHLNPYFGKMLLKSITKKDIERFLELKNKERMSVKRLNKCISLFGFMFKKFIEWNFISDSPYNGITNVKFPKNNRIQVLIDTEVDILLKTAGINYPNLYLPILLALSTGIKKSELLALKKGNFDPVNLKITVDKTIFEGKILPHKFKTSIRQLDIPEDVAFEITETLENKQYNDFVFYDTSLSWFTQDRKMRVEFSELIKQTKLHGITLNELRHTYACRALQNGMSIDYLHKQLGGYSIQATMDKYREFVLQ